VSSRTATIQMAVAMRLASDVDGGEITREEVLAASIALSAGIGAGNIDTLWRDTRTLAASATESLDLRGALVDQLGYTALFGRVKALLVMADPSNVNDVTLARGASNGAPLFIANGDGILVRPGGFLLLSCSESDSTGYAITGGTADLITLGNSSSGSTVTYTIVVMGNAT
jgi:hypothetical protein